MKNKKITAKERGIKHTGQRISMAMILCNILESKDGVSKNIKSATASSLINLMDSMFLDGEDDELKNLLNNSIDSFCEEMAEEGHENYRERLEETVRHAKRFLDEMKAKVNRIKEGEDILKGICLN